MLARGPVRELRLADVAAEPVQLTLLVQRQAERGMRRLGQVPTRTFGGGGRGRPVATGLEDLRAVDEALTSVRHQVGLRGTPPIEGLGPLGRAPEVRDLHARVDHAAVHDAGRNGRHVTRHDDDHRFVEQLHATRRLVQRERGLTATEQSEREQAFIVAALRLHEDGVGQPARGLRVAGAERDEEVLQHDQSAGGSLRAAFVDEPCGTREPSARVSDFAAQQQ